VRNVEIINKFANMEIQAAEIRRKVDDLTTGMVLMEEHLADLVKCKIIVEKQPADTHQVPRKTFAAAIVDCLLTKPIFQEQSCGADNFYWVSMSRLKGDDVGW
jgi:hypothetical protein